MEEDFRSTRVSLPPEAFAISNGEDSPPTDLISKETWTSMMSLPDDVSLRSSGHFGSIFQFLWDMWGNWPCIVMALQNKSSASAHSPMAYVALDTTDYFQGAIYNALVGYYRLAFTSLRGAVENMTIGMQYELQKDDAGFSSWLSGDVEMTFGTAADSVVKIASVRSLEKTLRNAVSDDLFHQKKLHGPTDKGGYLRRFFGYLSKYAHGAPKHSDGDIWESNGPIFVESALRSWTDAFLTAYAIGLLEIRLAGITEDVRRYGASDSIEGLFNAAIGMLPPDSDAYKLLRAIPDNVGQ